jgi:NADH-quinone oxidoreductase subunit L
LGGNNHFDKFLAPVFKVSAEAMPAGKTPGEGSSGAAAERSQEGNIELLMTEGSVGAALLGFFFAWFLYQRRPDLPDRIAAGLDGLYDTVRDKFYVDELYQAVIVAPLINGSSRVLWRGVDMAGIDATANDSAESARDVSDKVRHMQSGNIRSYAGWVALGAAVIVGYMTWVGLR